MNRLILIIGALLLSAGCIGDERIVTTVHEELEVDAVTSVSLHTGAGSLSVVGEEGLDRVLLDVELRSNRNVFATDQDAEDALVVTLERVDEERILGEVSLRDAPPGYWADVLMRVPPHLMLDAVDGSGETLVEDVAALELADDSGGIEVRRVPGSVTIVDDSGDLLVEDVGPLSIDDSSGTIEVRGVDGSVAILDGSGDVRCSDVRGDVEVTDDSGELFFERVEGTVFVRDTSGDVEAVDVGDLRMISDGSGEVRRR